MAAVAGRSPQGRTASVTTTTAFATITAPAGTFHEEDVGRTIAGTGIPAGRTIASVESDTAATMSGTATGTGTITATLGAGTAASYGFTGWSPESDTESETYTVLGGASAAAPGRILTPTQGIEQRSRV